MAKQITLYLVEMQNGRGKWQPYVHHDKHETEEAANAAAAKVNGRVLKVKALKLEEGDSIEAQRMVGRFNEKKDQHEVEGALPFSGVVAPSAWTPGKLRVGTHELAHPYVIKGKGAGLLSVTVA